MCRRLVWIQFANTYIPNHDEDDGVDDDVVDNDGLPLALKTYIELTHTYKSFTHTNMSFTYTNTSFTHV